MSKELLERSIPSEAPLVAPNDNLVSLAPLGGQSVDARRAKRSAERCVLFCAQDDNGQHKKVSVLAYGSPYYTRS